MPTVDDVLPIHALLAGLQAGEPLTSGALTVVPLLVAGAPEPGWWTLDEAGDAVAITEVSEEGVVPELTVASAADRPVLLLDGEELVGAKQNRVLNTTVLIGARATVRIPVSCVELGRWGYRTARFAPSGQTMYASLRARKLGRVTEALRQGRGHRSDQGEVWDELEVRARARKVASPTSAMHDVYQSYGEQIDAARRALSPRPGQVGALVYLAGSWVGLDLLASPGLFAGAWSRLSAGYAADAIGQHGRKQRRVTPATILDRLRRLRVEQARAVGLGEEYRFAASRMHGAALVADGRVAHLMAFPVTVVY